MNRGLVQFVGMSTPIPSMTVGMRFDESGPGPSIHLKSYISSFSYGARVSNNLHRLLRRIVSVRAQ